MKPYVRDQTLNEANKKRFGEEIRPKPYSTTDYNTKEKAFAPIHNLLANETQKRKEEIWKEVTEEVARRYYIDDDNNSTDSVVKMDNEYIIIVGRK